jgi:hypothetical protein
LQWESIKIKLDFVAGEGNYLVNETPLTRAITSHFGEFALDPMGQDGYSYTCLEVVPKPHLRPNGCVASLPKMVAEASKRLSSRCMAF